MLEHGGRLRRAADRYGIPLSDWLDLSTGINPNGWPVPAIPAACWRRLPEEDDNLVAAARAYYRNDSLLPVAGSQAAIQTLPLLRPACRVGVLRPAYAEHAASWQKAGHQLRIIDADSLDRQLDRLDVLILINPNNPTGTLWPPQQLLDWHARLNRRGGWLIVDEAFIDGMPAYSLSDRPARPGLIVLRSIGKFFGLAGIRCGFVLAEQGLLLRLAELLGPWTISHPGRYVAALALMDTEWQRLTYPALSQQSHRLAALLTEAGWPPRGGCHLFQWLQTADATEIHELLAEQGILTRLFDTPASLRFGLPGTEADWRRLATALSHPAISRPQKTADAAVGSPV
ncbi:threonine-phosphate decarboxylase CobD [Methylomonas sp. SURF-2]|uniref:threonine-phosphate decarboxylase n=1 Tax=Methylomonas subterranea TaxID=2952225 RepID=A0ABT1TK37_9GAMM|nr:threonine-phosphate decarboxylase CobD [Methylomonas sp. SURF-2]MCQ8105603.1 threonine-phosphate decarboxylase CobD [Methylomonas sp. SURF-2]